MTARKSDNGKSGRRDKSARKSAKPKISTNKHGVRKRPAFELDQAAGQAAAGGRAFDFPNL